MVDSLRHEIWAFGVMDEGNGTYYMRARYYAPEIGRFISKDPIGLLGGINAYSYAGSNPVNRTDPFGLWYIDINISVGLSWLIGGTGGLIIDTVTGDLRPYGGGIMSPGLGFSVTGSSSDPVTGWTGAGQLTGGLAGQLGYSFGEGGGWFGELGGGLGLPTGFGGLLTLFYVDEPLDLNALSPCY